MMRFMVDNGCFFVVFLRCGDSLVICNDVVQDGVNVGTLLAVC